MSTTISHDLLFDPDTLDLDKAGRVGRLEPTEFVHGRLLLVVQTLIRSVRRLSLLTEALTSSEYRPSTITFPLSNFNRTTPFTVR